MESIRCADHHGIDVLVGQHRVIIIVDMFRVVEFAEALGQIFIAVANGGQHGVAALLHRFKMSKL
jgi:hypothetical protein